MRVLIEGMEMPESCFDCPFMYGRRYCRANSKIEFNDPDYSELKGRYDGCPLVPVPAHGRLIEEADAVETAWMILRGLGYLKEENPQLEQTVREVFATTPAIEVEDHG